jgi:hypothetical protein
MFNFISPFASAADEAGAFFKMVVEIIAPLKIKVQWFIENIFVFLSLF